MSKKFIGNEGINKLINILSTTTIFPRESITSEEVNALWDKCDILSPESELDNWDYTLDEDNGIVTLEKYTNATVTNVIVYGAYSKDGKVYNAEVDGRSLFNKNKIVENITFKSKLPCSKKYNSTSNMFSECSNLKEINGLENLDISNVITMQYMFRFCTNLKKINGIEKWNMPESIRIMSYMFEGCTALTSLDLTSFNFSNRTNMNYAFYNCTNLKEIKVSSKYYSALYNITETNSNVFTGCGCSDFRYVKID